MDVNIRDLKTAWNEAGHIVWAWQNEWPPVFSTIDPAENAPDGCEGCTELSDRGQRFYPPAFYIAGLAGELLGAEHAGYEAPTPENHNDTWHAAYVLAEGSDVHSECFAKIPDSVALLEKVKPSIAADRCLEHVVATLLKERKLDHEQLENLHQHLLT